MPASPADDQVIVIRRGEDAVIPFAPPDPTADDIDVTGWSLAFSLSPKPGQPLVAGFPLTVGSGLVVTAAAAGAFTVTVTDAITDLLTSGGRYSWDLWRTDSGSEWPLANGTLVVKEPVRPPA